MTINFECEHCHLIIEAPGSAAGKKGKCPFCGLPNDVPLESTAKRAAIEFDFADEAPGGDQAPDDRPGAAAPASVDGGDEDDDDILPLAPLDEDEERHRLQRERDLLAQERDLLADTSGGGAEGVEQSEDRDVRDFYPLVIDYCRDMSVGQLERAQEHVSRLRQSPGLAKEAVEQFLAGQKTDEFLDRIPPPVVEGFLKSLRDELS